MKMNRWPEHNFFFHLFEWFHTKTHFIIEALADSEVAFYESCGQ